MHGARVVKQWGRVMLLGSGLIWACGGLSSVAADAAPVESPDPASYPESVEQAIARGVHYLLEAQNPNGSWGSARRTKNLNIYAPVPGAHDAFRSAVTAMALSALLETGVLEGNARAQDAFERGQAWLCENLPKVRRANQTAIYNVWAHAYGMQALLHLYERAQGDPARREHLKTLILQQVDLLSRYESVDGGWGYYDFDIGAKQPAASSTSFVNATVLIVFHQAREQGIELPERLVQRAIASTLRQQKNDFSYAYGEYLKMTPMRLVNRAAGSLGRSQACNLALRLWGQTNITDQVLATWLDRLVTRNGWLSIGRKRPVPHESWFQVAGYFFYYGHYYAALCIEELGEDQAPKYRRELADLLIPLQETDGSWWDFPFYDYHQPYGTAFALMALARCRPAPRSGDSP